MAVPKKVAKRIATGLRKLRPIVEQAKARDVNEADTVTIIEAALRDVFGWDPFFEVTSEFAIRGTFVDLAVKTEDHVAYLIEAKAIGSDLRDNHLRQAVNYAAHQGVEWVVLTNAAVWQIYRVIFSQPVDHELVCELQMLSDDPKAERTIEAAYLLSKEGIGRSAMENYHAQRQALSRFNLAAIVRQEPVLSIVRRELRRAYPQLNPSVDEIRHLLEQEVLKREVVEGDKAAVAMKAMRKADRSLRKRRRSEDEATLVADGIAPTPLVNLPTDASPVE